MSSWRQTWGACLPCPGGSRVQGLLPVERPDLLYGRVHQATGSTSYIKRLWVSLGHLWQFVTTVPGVLQESRVLLQVRLHCVPQSDTFMPMINLCKICQNGPLDKFMQFLFMRSSVQCIVMYGMITNMQYYLCDRYLTRIIHVNKSCTEICRFMVLYT